MEDKFSLFPIEKYEWEGRGIFGDPARLPFEIVKDVCVEDVSNLIPKDEFTYCERELGTETTRHLQQIKYAIVHRFKNFEEDPTTGKFILEPELLEKSRWLIQRIVACLRLIRPTTQHAQFMGGTVEHDGTLRRFHFDNPFTYVNSIQNQKFFTVRTKDIKDLRFYAPLFIDAIEKDHTKYIMAVDMYQSGFFQHSYWKLRFFMWAAALEALFTSHTSDEHRGSLVAKERIKWVLGADTLIYPAGELTQYDPPSSLTVRDVLDEIYCLRNHIAHGDRVPQYYFETVGRTGFGDYPIYKGDMLSEAISSIVRQTLLHILKHDLIQHFKDSTASENYIKGHTKKLLKASLKKSGSKPFPCPK